MSEVISPIPETPVADAITTWARIYRRLLKEGLTCEQFLLQYGRTPIKMSMPSINTVGELIEILISIGL